MSTRVKKAGTLVARRGFVNFIDGAGISITVGSHDRTERDMRKRTSAALVAALLFLASCASTPRYPYVACHQEISGGRTTFEVGRVTGEKRDGDGSLLLVFESQFWGRTIDVAERKINKFCAAASAVFTQGSLPEASAP